GVARGEPVVGVRRGTGPRTALGKTGAGVALRGACVGVVPGETRAGAEPGTDIALGKVRTRGGSVCAGRTTLGVGRTGSARRAGVARGAPWQHSAGTGLRDVVPALARRRAARRVADRKRSTRIPGRERARV